MCYVVHWFGTASSRSIAHVHNMDCLGPIRERPFSVLLLMANHFKTLEWWQCHCQATLIIGCLNAYVIEFQLVDSYMASPFPCHISMNLSPNSPFLLYVYKLGIQNDDTIVTWHRWHPHHHFEIQKHPTQLATSSTWSPPQLGDVLRQDGLNDR